MGTGDRSAAAAAVASATEDITRWAWAGTSAVNAAVKEDVKTRMNVQMRERISLKVERRLDLFQLGLPQSHNTLTHF